jgi:hypothetical protein
MSKNEIYNKTLLWMAQTFNSSKSVIELQDSSQGLIVGNGIVLISYMLAERPIAFVIKIEIKDNKYRLSTSKYVQRSPEGDAKMYKDMADLTKNKIFMLQKSLHEFLISKPKDF